MPRIPFAKHSYEIDSLPASAQRLVNLYAEELPPNSRSEVLVRNVPGLVEWATIGEGPIRAGAILGQFAYIISGNEVWKVGPTFPAPTTPVLIGAVYSGLATMAASSKQIVIVTAPLAYVIDLDDTFSPIDDPDFPGAVSVAYQGGVFIFAAADPDDDSFTDYYFISDILNAASYSALDFASAEAIPDKLLRVFVSHDELWLFSTTSIEVHHNTGNVDFPYSPQSGGLIEVGTPSGLSVAKFDNTVAWLGNDRIVYRANGYVPQRISTHAIEKVIARYAEPMDAIGFATSYEGHDQYCLTLPAADVTYVYDAATKLWHERASGAGGTGRWRGNMALRFGPLMLIGDQNSGKLFRMDHTVATEGGAPLTAIATLPPLWGETHRAIMNRLEVECETGGNSSEMSLSLDYSDDGGFTYNFPQLRSMGTSGDRRRRVFWNRLGNFRQRVLRFTATPGAKLALYGADVDATGLKA